MGIETHMDKILGLVSNRIMESLPNGDYCSRLLPYSRKGKAAASCNFRDRTIDLSDATLFLILSFLPMKDAARTSILSRRWRDMWKSRNSIKFDVDEILGAYPRVSRCAGNVLFEDEPSTSEQFDEFVRLVDHYFDHKLGSEIKAFGLHIRSRIHHRHIQRWLSLANEMNVEKISVDFSGADTFYHPYHLYVGGNILSLNHFSLSHCALSIRSDFNGFNSLTTVAFQNVHIPDYFISYCPLLERLTLLDCRGLTNLKIACLPRNLKYVRVLNSCRFLEINAQNLIHFECSGFVEAFLYPFVDGRGNFYDLHAMGFPNPKTAPSKCVFTPDPDFGGFKSLKVLALFDVTILSSHLRNLLANCSLVTELTFDNCSFFLIGSTTLEIYRLVHLQSVKVLKCSSIRKVIVRATNLKTFVFVAGSARHLPTDSFELLDSDGNNFLPVVRKGSLLKHLHLRGSKFTMQISNFSTIETVILEDMYLTDEHIGDLLSNCLLLKRLDLIECHGIFTLNIVGGPFLQLKYLTVTYCKKLTNIIICTANLVEFKYHGPLVCFSLIEAPQLYSVDIKIEANDYDFSTNYVLSMLSKDVPQLETLIFHIEDIKVPDALPTFCTLKHLVLFFGDQLHQLHNLSWATLFLVASPVLEKFQVQLPRRLSAVAELSKTWTHQHLKEVALFMFEGVTKEMKFATHLLHNAKSLELMKIDPRPINSPSKPPIEWVQGWREKTIQLLRKEAKPDLKLVIL